MTWFIAFISLALLYALHITLIKRRERRVRALLQKIQTNLEDITADHCKTSLSRICYMVEVKLADNMSSSLFNYLNCVKITDLQEKALHDLQCAHERYNARRKEDLRNGVHFIEGSPHV